MNETLDLYKSRQPYEVILEVKGKKKSFKIPSELTVEESERLLESEIKIKMMVNEKVSDDAEKKLEIYFGTLIDYMLVLLQHYQPEITADKIKKMMSRSDLEKVFEFFKQQRYIHIMGYDEPADQDGAKKKIVTTEEQLDSLRQSIVYLVMNGFGLNDIRKLYLDEMLSFYQNLIYIKEKRGEIKDGTYNQLKAKGGNEVSSLKNQLFNIQSNGK
jgi:hypothetical protein